MAFSTVRLESISERLDYGLTASATDRATGTRFVRITDIQDDRIDWKNVPYCDCSESDAKKYQLQQGDILFARTGSVGKSCLVEVNPGVSVFASYLIRLRLNCDQALPNFMSYYFMTQDYWRQITETAAGGIQQGVNASKLGELLVPCPLIAEQERVTGILDKADRLRRLRRNAQQMSETLLQSVFLKMFGDPVKNPMNFEQDHLIGACLPNGIKAGPFGSSLKKQYYAKSGIRIYGQEQVIAGNFAIGDYYISEEMFEGFKQYEVKQGDVLISLVGTLGKVVVVPEGIGRGIINPRVLKVSPNPNKLDSNFLSHLIKHPLTQRQLSSVAHGGTMDILNAGLLKELRVIIPPLHLQQQFARVVQKFECLRSQQREAERQAEHLFQTLLKRAFAGEL